MANICNEIITNHHKYSGITIIPKENKITYLDSLKLKENVTIYYTLKKKSTIIITPTDLYQSNIKPILEPIYINLLSREDIEDSYFEYTNNTFTNIEFDDYIFTNLSNINNKIKIFKYEFTSTFFNYHFNGLTAEEAILQNLIKEYNDSYSIFFEPKARKYPNSRQYKNTGTFILDRNAFFGGIDCKKVQVYGGLSLNLIERNYSNYWNNVKVTSYIRYLKLDNFNTIASYDYYNFNSNTCNHVAIIFWLPLYDNIKPVLGGRGLRKQNITDLNDYNEYSTTSITFQSKESNYMSFKTTMNNNGIFSNWAWINNDEFNLKHFTSFLQQINDDSLATKSISNTISPATKDFISNFINDMTYTKFPDELKNMKLYNTENLLFILQISIFQFKLFNKILKLINETEIHCMREYKQFPQNCIDIKYIFSERTENKLFIKHMDKYKFIFNKIHQVSMNTILNPTAVEHYYDYLVYHIGQIILRAETAVSQSSRGYYANQPVTYFRQKIGHNSQFINDYEISWLTNSQLYNRIMEQKNGISDEYKTFDNMGTIPLLDYLYYIKDNDFLYGNDIFGKYEWHPMRCKFAKAYVTGMGASGWVYAWYDSKSEGDTFRMTTLNELNIQEDLLFLIEYFKFNYNYNSVVAKPEYFSKVLHDMVEENKKNKINPNFFEVSPIDPIYAIEKDHDIFIQDITSIDSKIYEQFFIKNTTQTINENNIKDMLPDNYKFVTTPKTGTRTTERRRLLNYNILGKAIKKVYDIIYFKSN